MSADVVIFAMGGGSWKVTGSDGGWMPLFINKGINTSPFYAVNCGFTVEWQTGFKQAHAGKPLKNVIVSIGDHKSTGELLITDYGLEGNAIYALSYHIQESLQTNPATQITVDFKPSRSLAEISNLLSSTTLPIGKVLTDQIKISKPAIALLKSELSKEEYLDSDILARNIKAFQIPVSKPRSLDEAISTTGGVVTTALSDRLELKDLPNHYCIGEMVDWYAPTGGYLIQGCMSMGKYLAGTLNDSIDATPI